MPSSYATRRFTNLRLVPMYEGAYNRRRSVNLTPSTTYAAGTVLGLAGAAANDVQTLTTTGTPTGGSQTVTFVDPLSGHSNTFVVAFDSSAAAAQTNIRAAIGNSDVAVTGGAQPGTALVFTFTGRYASVPVGLMTTSAAFTGGTAPAASFAHTTQGRTANTYGTYVGGSATDPAKCILEYACVSDGNGWVVKGAQSYSGEGGVDPSATAWFGGIFKVGDITGLDAGAVVDLGARLENGAVTDSNAIITIF